MDYSIKTNAKTEIMPPTRIIFLVINIQHLCQISLLKIIVLHLVKILSFLKLQSILFLDMLFDFQSSVDLLTTVLLAEPESLYTNSGGSLRIIIFRALIG